MTQTQASPDELERFSERVSRGKAAVHTFSRFEHEVRWEMGDRSGSARTIRLRSGLELSLSRVRWERSWALGFAPDPSTLKFLITRGPGPTLTPAGGAAHELASGTAHVSRIRRQVELHFEFGEATAGEHEQLCLEVERARLCELMGTSELPALAERIWQSPEDYPYESLSAPPVSFRLLDELSHCDARGNARQLQLEAKGLELLAAWIDHLEEERDASRLGAHDIACLERARLTLLARMAAPPSLPELARLSHLNEAKLKAGFRVHFGDTVFGYLRRRRLEEAWRLLRRGGYNVTEVANRVGYSNPSKFAAAFKAHFGISPSQVR